MARTRVRACTWGIGCSTSLAVPPPIVCPTPDPGVGRRRGRRCRTSCSDAPAGLVARRVAVVPPARADWGRPAVSCGSVGLDPLERRREDGCLYVVRARVCVARLKLLQLARAARIAA